MFPVLGLRPFDSAVETSSRKWGECFLPKLCIFARTLLFVVTFESKGEAKESVKRSRCYAVGMFKDLRLYLAKFRASDSIAFYRNVSSSRIFFQLPKRSCNSYFIHLFLRSSRIIHIAKFDTSDAHIKLFSIIIASCFLPHALLLFYFILELFWRRKRYREIRW